MGNRFQNINCISWIKLIPVLIHLKYWYYNSPYLELPCLPHHVLHRFLYFLYPIRSQNTTSSEYTKPYAKTSQSNFFWSYIQIIIPSGSTRCPTKNWVFKSRFSFKVMQHSQQQHKVLHLQDKVCQVLYKMVSAPSFSQHYLCKQTTLQYSPKNRSSTSVNFYLLFHPYLFRKPSVQSPPTSPSSMPQPFFTALFCVQPSKNSALNIFSLSHPFFQLRLPQGPMELGSLVRTNTVFISPFFLKVYAAITGLTIIDSLLIRLRKYVL